MRCESSPDLLGVPFDPGGHLRDTARNESVAGPPDGKTAGADIAVRDRSSHLIRPVPADLDLGRDPGDVLAGIEPSRAHGLKDRCVTLPGAGPGQVTLGSLPCGRNAAHRP